jgi:hypothetical protein
MLDSEGCDTFPGRSGRVSPKIWQVWRKNKTAPSQCDDHLGLTSVF